MEEFFKETAASAQQIHLGTFLLKLVISTVFGALLAFHPRYLKKVKTKPARLNIAKAQVLVCLAGTIMVIVIGDNVARAFGLFGLGSLIRFRTPLKKATDTATLFILIAIGMAVGIGLYVHAVIVVVFLYVILFPLESFQVEKSDVQDAAPPAVQLEKTAGEKK